MIIDIHTHIFPDELAPRALEALSHNNAVHPFTDGTAANLCASMEAAGIDLSVVMPIATKPSQVQRINRWAKGIQDSYKGLVCFGTLHPQHDDWRTEIDWLVDHGILGVKMHPDFQNFFVDDSELIPIYKALADAGLILLLHAGADIGLPPPVHCTPDRLSKMLDGVPELTLIAAHMGGYTCWDDVERYLIGRNLYLDTSYSLADLGPKRTAEMIRNHGVDRILFGTDSPWADQSIELKEIRTLPLEDDEIGCILGVNALGLLQISGL